MLSPSSRRGDAQAIAFEMLVRIVATMLPAAQRFGIATAAEVELDTLGERSRAKTQTRQAVVGGGSGRETVSPRLEQRVTIRVS
jgi:hypothetical protein